MALVLVAPFVGDLRLAVHLPDHPDGAASFTKAPLIGAGTWVGLDNYAKLFADRVFRTAVWNTAYFVLLTVIPGTAGGARHRADGEPPEGLDAEHRPGGVLPALHPAGHGRLPDLALDARPAVRHPAVHHRAARRRAASMSGARPPWFMPMASPSSPSGGRTDSPSFCSSPASGTSRQSSTRRPSSTAPPAGSNSGASPGR